MAKLITNILLRIKITVLVLLFFLPVIQAEPKETVPFGIFKINANVSQINHDRFFSNEGNPISGKQYLTRKYRLDKNNVNGNYSYSETNLKLNILTGLFKDFALEIDAVNSTVKEKSNITYSGEKDSVRAAYFEQLHNSGESSGMKNMKAMLLWEPLYKRSVSLLFGAGYTHGFNNQNFDKPGSPLVGTGINYVGGLFQLSLYSRVVENQLSFLVYIQNPQNTVNVKLPDGNKVSFKKSTKNELKLEDVYRNDRWKFSGYLQFLNEGNSELNYESLDDSRRELIAGFGVYFNNYLEFIAANGSTNEYELGIQYSRSIIGYQTALVNRYDFTVKYLF